MPFKDKEYAKEYNRNRYLKHQDEKMAASKSNYWANREIKLLASREAALKRKYNIDNEQYLQMLLDQNNVCAICHKPEHRKDRVGDVKPLSVDHCHTTGLVRALLCNDCNFLLGFCKDDPVILTSALEYLRKHTEES